MSYYANETLEKAYSRFAEKEDSILTADISLVPHQEYERDTTYKLTGLGSTFNGEYRLTKVVHTISPSGYTVEAEARMIFDSKGNSVEGGYKPATPPPPPPKPPPKPKAPVKVKADKKYTVKSGDTLWGIASRFCKSPLDWKEIEKKNRAQLIARDKRNATMTGHWIFPSQKLIIPGLLLK